MQLCCQGELGEGQQGGSELRGEVASVLCWHIISTIRLISKPVKAGIVVTGFRSAGKDRVFYWGRRSTGVRGQSHT